METPFRIVFELNLNGSGKIMRLQGEAMLYHSTPHYKITRISRVGQNSGPDILPEVDLKCISDGDGQFKWVHRDSGKETYLSQAIGAAIEDTGEEPQVAEEEEAEEEED